MNRTKKAADTVTRVTTDPSIAPIVSYLETICRKLIERFFESQLSKPVITVSPDPQRKDKLGWCTVRRVWKDGQSDGHFEINVCAEKLNLPAKEICAVLLHELCHLHNAEAGIKDTSRGGSYHNGIFKETAEAHGLVADHVKQYGYKDTRLSPEADEFIATLELTPFELHRDDSIDRETADEPEKKPSSTRKYECPVCKTIIRATKDVSVSCDECKVLFVKKS